MLVRSKRAESNRRRRLDAAGHRPTRPTQAAAREVQRQGHEGHEEGHRHPGTGRLANDRALYTCQCGYVFEAPVCTSVGCPHCGGTQAW